MPRTQQLQLSPECYQQEVNEQVTQEAFFSTKKNQKTSIRLSRTQ
jgi:hypothetical protein